MSFTSPEKDEHFTATSDGLVLLKTFPEWCKPKLIIETWKSPGMQDCSDTWEKWVALKHPHHGFWDFQQREKS